jgi:hypothetical protein
MKLVSELVKSQLRANSWDGVRHGGRALDGHERPRPAEAGDGQRELEGDEPLDHEDEHDQHDPGFARHAAERLADGLQVGHVAQQDPADEADQEQRQRRSRGDLRGPGARRPRAGDLRLAVLRDGIRRIRRLPLPGTAARHDAPGGGR